MPLGLASTQTWAQICSQLKRQVPKNIDPKACFIKVLDPHLVRVSFLLRLVQHIERPACPTGQRSAQMPVPNGGRHMCGEQRHSLRRTGAAPTAGRHRHHAELSGHPSVALQQEPGLSAEEADALQVHLGNPLDPHDHPEINKVFRSAHFTVVLGNPPYNNHLTHNGDWIQNLLQPYKSLNGKSLGRRVCLNDDYLKFIRLGEHLIEATGLESSPTSAPTATSMALLLTALGPTSRPPLTRSECSTCTATPTAENGIPTAKAETRTSLPSSRGWPSCCVSGTPRTHSSLRSGLETLWQPRPQASAVAAGQPSKPLRSTPHGGDHPGGPQFSTASNATRGHHRVCQRLFGGRAFEQSVVGIQTGCDALVIDPDKAMLTQRMQAWYRLRHADTDTLSHWLTEIGLTRPSQITRMIGKLSGPA